MRVACSNSRRQAPGFNKGSSPSNTSISASAPSHQSDTAEAPVKQPLTGASHPPGCKPIYLPPGAKLPPRMALKNSLLGSTTMTSFLLLKLAR